MNAWMPAGTAVLVVAAGVLWGVVASSRPDPGSTAWRLRALGATAATIAAIVAIVVAWAVGGWWFVGEKLVVFVPLAGAALAWFAAATGRVRSVGGSQIGGWPVRAAAAAGAIAAAAGLAVQFAVGLPAPPWAFAAVVLLAVGAAALTALRLRGGMRRPVAATGAGLGCVAVAATVMVLASAAGPAALVAHAHGTGIADAGIVDAGQAAASISITDLRSPAAGPVDVHVELEAQAQRVTLPSGATVDAWTYGALAGPAIDAVEGDVVEVVLRNRDIAEGVTVHWHGYEVPAGEDGVAGVTQDAVAPGDAFTYRFTASQPGTYWYHTHQRAAKGVVRGLYGSLVVHEKDVARADVEVTLPLHSFGGALVMGASDVPQAIPAGPGDAVRVRLINTDQVPHLVAVQGTAFRVLALDGRDVGDPGLLEGQALRIPAGGRADVGFELGDRSVTVQAAASPTAMVTVGDGEAAGAAEPARFDAVFDPLAYDRAGRADAPAEFDVERTLVLDRLPRLLGGAPTFAYTVDGEVYPHVPPTIVREGDLVKLTVVNRGWETHPMHPHGHHVRVLSVDGRAPTGGPVMLDTFDVQPGQTWVVALTADNPGIWMDHCHNLDHAALGMVTHLAYVGVPSPFEHGGAAGNAPE